MSRFVYFCPICLKRSFFVMVLFFILYHVATAQDGGPGLAAKKILDFCKSITDSTDNVQQKLEVMWPIHKCADSQRLSRYAVDKAYIFDSVGFYGRFTIYSDRTQNKKYVLNIEPNSNYCLNGNDRPVFEDTSFCGNISYPELIELFGAAKPDYPLRMQPKDTKHYHFNYVNPVTKRQCVINVVSFNSPESVCNTIYSLKIFNVELKD